MLINIDVYKICSKKNTWKRMISNTFTVVFTTIEKERQWDWGDVHTGILNFMFALLN